MANSVNRWSGRFVGIRRSWRVIAVAAAIMAGGMASDATAGTWVSVSTDGTVSAVQDGASGPPQVMVGWHDDSGLSVQVDVAGLEFSRTTTKGGEFVSVGWPELSTAGEIGYPAIPVVRRLFIAPPQADVSVATAQGPPVIIDGQTLGFPLVMMSVQSPIEKIPGAIQSAPFDFDEAAYSVDADSPAERALITELGIMRGQRLFLLEVYPVAYNPVADTVSFWNDIAIEIRFEGGVASSQQVAPFARLQRQVLNPVPVSPSGRSLGNYLIMVAQAYESAIISFADAKASQGYDVTTYSVPSGTSKEAIKAQIEALYGGPDSPDYVLLVGDTNTIPHWTGGGAGSPATDLQYGCMDGGDDWAPDIPTGRFPVRSVDQLDAIVDKTLYYENGPLSDPDYVNRAVFMASEDNWTVSEGTHNYVIDTYMVPGGIVSDKLYSHTYSATTQQVRDSFNDGRFFGIYSGHGGTYSWADGPPFSQSDVNNLTNGDMYAFVMSFACITGTYTVDECFVETWVRAPEKGAVTMYGSSVNSYWTEDDVLEKRLFDSIYDSEDEVASEVGPVWIDTLTRYVEQMGSGSTTRRYFEMYNLMGDPSLRFPGADGYAMTVGFPSGVPELLTPDEPTDIIIQIIEGGESYVSGSGTLHYRYDGGEFLTTSFAPLGEELYQATLPPASCGETPEFYVSVEGTESGVLFQPPGGASSPLIAGVGEIVVIMSDDFDSDLGWTVENIDIEEGIWERGVPVGGGLRGDPPSGFGGAGQCFLTGNEAGNSDVDGGPTRLISPTIDLGETGDYMLSYARWYTNDDLDGDRLDIEISNDGGESWVLIESVPDTEGWVERSMRISDFVMPSSQIKVRFSAADVPNNSIDEAALDSLLVTKFACESDLGDGDFDLDGDVDLSDFASFQACFDRTSVGGCEPGDMEGNGVVDIEDFVLFAGAMGGPQ